MKVRANLAATHIGPETLEEAVQDYVNRNTDLYDLPGMVSVSMRQNTQASSSPNLSNTALIFLKWIQIICVTKAILPKWIICAVHSQILVESYVPVLYRKLVVVGEIVWWCSVALYLLNTCTFINLNKVNQFIILYVQCGFAVLCCGFASPVVWNKRLAKMILTCRIAIILFRGVFNSEFILIACYCDIK